MTGPAQPLLLTPVEAATALGRSVDQLRRWRARGRGPEFFDLERGLVRYSRESVEAVAAELRLRHERAMRNAGTDDDSPSRDDAEGGSQDRSE